MASLPSPPTSQPDKALPPRPLHPETYINSAVNLVDLTPDPGILARKVYLITKLFSHGGIGTEGVEGGCYHGGFLLLVVKEGEHGGGHDEDEEGECALHLGGD